MFPTGQALTVSGIITALSAAVFLTDYTHVDGFSGAWDAMNEYDSFIDNPDESGLKPQEVLELTARHSAAVRLPLAALVLTVSSGLTAFLTFLKAQEWRDSRRI